MRRLAEPLFLLLLNRIWLHPPTTVILRLRVRVLRLDHGPEQQQQLLSLAQRGDPHLLQVAVHEPFEHIPRDVVRLEALGRVGMAMSLEPLVDLLRGHLCEL